MQPSDYAEFYGRLYAEIEREYGPLDDDAVCSSLPFHRGGPVALSKIEGLGLYVSCELCSIADQKPAFFGPFELLAQGPGLERWARTVLTSIAAVSLETPLDHQHILDISSCVAAERIDGRERRKKAKCGHGKKDDALCLFRRFP